METLKGKEALTALMGVLPYVINALPSDMSLYVTDGKQYLYAAEGPDLQTGITVGSEHSR